MKVLLSWLREFAPLSGSVDEIGNAFGMLGTPVEDVERVGEGLDDVVVARVLDVNAIEGADYIQLVHVDAGGAQPKQIVCGARNFGVDDLVPLAPVGAVLPNGAQIAQRKMRGQVSEGMLCSPDELKLGGRGDGLLILGGDLEPGMPLREALGIESDVLWELEINPNRPDAMSVAGLARDLAAWFKVPFALPGPEVKENGPPTGDLVTVEVVDRHRCGRFTARVLQDVTVQPSPRSIASRLTLLGMRPINNVVDVSNYVMLELGQPSHPYDLDLVGGRGLRVRRARQGEKLVTLDDVERTLTDEDLLICDGHDVPNGIGGVMGGAASEISDSTRNVLVEMAWFLPIGIAKSSRRLGVRSEASARFEKGCDPEIIELAHARFIELLGDSVGTVAAGMVDVVGVLPARPPVRVRTPRVNALLGTDLQASDIAAVLDPIGFATEARRDGDTDVTIPSWRYDSAAEIDIVEEIARHYGYDRIGKEMPTAPRIGGLSPRQRDRRHIRNVLVGLGLAEALPTPFLAPGDLARTGLPDDGITVTNPLVAEESVLRTSLLPGLLKAVLGNESHRVEGAALFEIDHVFLRPKQSQPLPDEREYLAAVIAGEEAPAAVQVWAALAEALDIENHALVATEAPGLHPTRTASVLVDGEAIGVVGEADPRVLEAWGISERIACLEVDLGRILDLPHGEHHYRLVSRYPSSDIDLAFETPDSVAAAEVEVALRNAAGDVLASLELFDVYRGAGVQDGARSLAFHLRLQATDHTLTDAEIAEVRLRCIEAVTAATGASLRG